MRLVDRWLGVQLRLSQGRGRLLGAGAAVLTLAGVYLLVAITGGTPNPLVHLAYFGVIAAAVSFGWIGGVAAGATAGLLLGPLMPDSTASSATVLGTWGWVIRLGVYATAGVLIGSFVGWARQLGAIEVRRRRMRALLDQAQAFATGQEACRQLLTRFTHEWGLVGGAIFGLAPNEAFLLAASSPDHSAVSRPERLEDQDLAALLADASGAPRRRPFITRVLREATAEKLRAHGVRSELVVPLRAGSGDVIGILYASDIGVPRDLSIDELQALDVLSHGAAALVTRAQSDESANAQRLQRRIAAVLRDPAMLQPHVQPIVSLLDGRIHAYEALARFGRDAGPPTTWFADAARAGQGAELQALAIARAREIAAANPPIPGSLLAVNLSPSYLVHESVVAALSGDLGAIVIELSEAEEVSDYEALRRHLATYRARGAQIAVDDAGAGYASMRHVTELRPDFVKLDARLITGLRDDTGRQALVRAIEAFTSEIHAHLVAEGVETPDDLELLHSLDRNLLVQGYAVARPAPPWPEINPEAMRLLQRTSTREHGGKRTRLTSRLAAS